MEPKPLSIAFALGLSLSLLASAWGAASLKGVFPSQETFRHRAEDVPKDTLPAEHPAELPRGLEEFADAPAASPATVALGRRLFFDPILSGDRTIACATCHRPDHGFAEPRAKSIGIDGQDVGRNAPSLLNHALSEAVLWDGRADSLETQALMVISEPKEMGLPIEEALARLSSEGDYAAMFEAAFGGPPTDERLAKALASFVRSLTFGDSPVDAFRAGDVVALNSAEENGMWLFEGRGRCWQCHVGPNFSDSDFHNTGVGAVGGVPEEGRTHATGDDADRGKFRTPGLRGVALTAPYMHDGSLATLRDVVEFYREGGGANSHLTSKLGPIDMTDQEAENLVAFLEALSRRVE